MRKVIVIGAGFGGLTAAAELARAGLDVTVLEAHVYPGGCAGTFYHQGYWFDAGATLAGGFSHGGPMDMLADRFGIDWEAKPASRAMVIHMPDGYEITRWTNQQRWMDERVRVFGSGAETFWQWQEKTADALWDLALRGPNWLPQSFTETVKLSQTGIAWLRDQLRLPDSGKVIGIIPQAFQSVAARLKNAPERLRLFIDGQLLISSQALSEEVNALHGAAALDLARRGVVHIPGGMGGLADRFVKTIQRYGGKVNFRQEVISVSGCRDGAFCLETKRKHKYHADAVIFNLTPFNIAKLFKEEDQIKHLRIKDFPPDVWGAFVLHAGVKAEVIPDGFAEHHQIIHAEPLGEGNSIFVSINPIWDRDRAPQGKRTITITTHTKLETWWSLYSKDRSSYERRKYLYTEKVLDAAEHVLPGIKSSMDLLLPGTPVTYNRFTHREKGWVGGFPQTSLLRSMSPRIAPGLWMVGDSIFPGQSVPAVALGGMRVANSLLDEIVIRKKRSMFRIKGKLAEGHYAE